MALKKVLSVLLVIFIVFGIAACGIELPGANKDDDDSKVSSRDKDDDDDGKDKDDDDRDSDDKDDDDKDSKDKDDDDEDSDDKNDDRDSDDKDDDDRDEDKDKDDDDDDDANPLAGLTSADLPDGFPVDDYPFMKGTTVTYATQATDNGRVSFIVSGMVSKPVNDVKAYYNNILALAENKQDSSGDGYYTLWGKFAGYEFYLMLSEDTSNSSNSDSSTLLLQLAEVLTPESALDTLSKADLPDDYPVDLFPIIDNAVVTDATESESDGIMSYDITITTTHTFKEIVAFYEEQLGTIEDKSKSIDSDGFSFTGTANGYYFYMSGYTTTTSGVNLQSYYLSIDPLD